MPTPFESAQLLLTLYDLRREDTMRKARDFFTGFLPNSFEEYMAGISGPNGAYIRQVTSYWDMAAGFVVNGAIDEKMFFDATLEFLYVFAKVQPFLPQLRAAYSNPDFAKNLETVALRLPNAQERIDQGLARLRSMIAARAAKA